MVTYCSCGCGERTKGGDFRPGHDQKLRSAIESEVGGLLKLRELVEKSLGRQIETAKKNGAGESAV